MKSWWLIVGCFSLSLCTGFAQQSDPRPFPVRAQSHPQYAAADNAYKSARYEEAVKGWLDLLSKYPDDGDVYSKAGLSFLQLKEFEKALQFLNAANDLNPFHSDTQLHLGMLHALRGNAEASKHHLRILAITAWEDEAVLSYQVEYLSSVVNAWRSYNPSNANLLQQNITYLQSERKLSGGIYRESIIKPASSIEEWVRRNDGARVSQHLEQVKKTVSELSLPRIFYQRVLIVCADLAQKNKNPGIHGMIIKVMADEFRDHGKHPFLRFSLYQHITVSLASSRDFESCLSYNSIISEDLSKQGHYHFLLVDVFLDRIQWLSQLDRKAEAKQLTNQLEKTALQYNNPVLIVRMYEALCIAFSGEDSGNAVTYGERGMAHAKAKGVDDSSIRSALMVAYDKAKMFSKAAAITSDFNSLPVDAENQGTVLINQGQYSQAIPLLKRACDGYAAELTTKTAAEKYVLIQDYYRAVQKLAYCYSTEKKDVEALELIEQSKGRILAEKVGIKVIPRVHEIQQMLDEDEAMVYFIESIFEGEFLAYVITKETFRPKYIATIDGLRPVLKNYNRYLVAIDKEMSKESLRQPTMRPMDAQTPDAEVKFNEGEFSLVVELFRRTMNPSGREEALFDVHKTFNQLSRIISVSLLNEVFPDIALHKKLIIVPDGALNFIPFEALKTPLGKFVIEKFDVSYVSSATVLSALKARQYKNYEKPILAMGGAIYNETSAQPLPLNSMADLESLRLKVFHDLTNNTPLQYAYASLGYGKMNYLPGTLAEVQNIKSIIGGAEIATGEEMNETKVKTLSKQGALTKYRVLHFATHGWVSPLLDELSGIAMTIPTSDQNGQDGYLTKYEAEQLNIKADVVMLSACQTALGKQVRGEGVVGLSQAFVTAGANATISSLWPVDDYGTSVLVSELYKKVFLENISFATALNQVKRNFIKGVYNTEDRNLTAPKYWAPFLFFGRDSSLK